MITINEKDFNPLQRLMNKLHPDAEVFVFNEDKPGWRVAIKLPPETYDVLGEEPRTLANGTTFDPDSDPEPDWDALKAILRQAQNWMGYDDRLTLSTWNLLPCCSTCSLKTGTMRMIDCVK
jgi:hypothetical protein